MLRVFGVPLPGRREVIGFQRDVRYGGGLLSPQVFGICLAR